MTPGPTGYRITCKLGEVLTDEQGRIFADRVGRNYECSPRDGWRIVGIGTRANSARLVTLSEAADGANIGQGWIHDWDHGSYRMWGMPTYRRALKVTRLSDPEQPEVQP